MLLVLRAHTNTIGEKFYDFDNSIRYTWNTYKSSCSPNYIHHFCSYYLIKLFLCYGTFKGLCKGHGIQPMAKAKSKVVFVTAINRVNFFFINVNRNCIIWIHECNGLWISLWYKDKLFYKKCYSSPKQHLLRYVQKFPIK